MTWALWGILGGLMCVGTFVFIGVASLRFWSSWNVDKRMLAAAGWAGQLFHGLFIIVIGALSMRVDRLSLHASAAAILIGALLFSGALYAMVFDRFASRSRLPLIAGTVLLAAGWCGFIVTLAAL